MRKDNYYVWALVILIILGYFFFDIIFSYRMLGNENQNSVLIGTWVLKEDEQNAHFRIKKLEFVDDSTLLLLLLKTARGEDEYNIKYQYSFFDKNKIHVSAPRRLSDEWQINIDENKNLIIYSEIWPGGVGKFEKIPTINWLYLAIALGILILKVSLKWKVQGPLFTDATLYTRSNLRQASFSKIFGYLFALTVGFLLGFALWGHPILRQIKMPWDAIIVMELGFVLLMASIQMLIRISTKYWKIITVFFIGLGVAGVVVGVARCLIIVIFGGYI